MSSRSQKALLCDEGFRTMLLKHFATLNFLWCLFLFPQTRDDFLGQVDIPLYQLPVCIVCWFLFALRL